MRRGSTAWMVIAAGLIVAGCSRSNGIPPPPPADRLPVQGIVQADSKSAQSAWKPLHGAKPLSVEKIGDRSVLRLPCDFKVGRQERVTWEKNGKLDLGSCGGIHLQVFCPDPSPIQTFNIYFHSGDGWYAGFFTVTNASGWNTVTIDKADTRIEDKPAGWANIDTVRISLWRGKSVNTDFYIAGMGLHAADVPVAIVRGESVQASQRPAELGSVMSYTTAMAERLRALQIPFCMISDHDLTAERLAGRKVVVLPHNPEMPERVVKELSTYLAGEGKLVSFYMLPPGLQTAVNIKNGQFVKAVPSGKFASIRRCSDDIAGLPAEVGQTSWNIFQSQPVEGKSRVAARWYDDRGKDTGEPAIVASDNCIHTTHVLLTDDAGAKHTMLLAMLGHFVPELWRDSADRKLALSAELCTALGDVAPGSASSGDSAAARTLSQEAIALFNTGCHVEAFEKADSSLKLQIKAWCEAQVPAEREFHGMWCHSAFGVSGMNWDESVRVLADNGFNAVFPNVAWAGTAYYPSKVLPEAPELAQKGDQVAQCLAACRKYGVECHVWRVCWNMSNRAVGDFAARMKKEGRTQVAADGSAIADWLCPSHPANRKLEVDSMLELVRNYAVDGIHFDYIRYPGWKGCYCAGCRRQFEQVAGTKVRRWPDDVRKEGDLRLKWLKFRQDNITAVVSTVSREARKIRPGVKVSAAVFTDIRIARKDVGQDWELWCSKGYLDFLCPMDYETDIAKFGEIVKEQLTVAGKTPCYPGIGLSTWPYADDNVCRLVEQALVSRKLGAPGFMIFHYGVSEAREAVPMLGLGITRKALSDKPQPSPGTLPD